MTGPTPCPELKHSGHAPVDKQLFDMARQHAAARAEIIACHTNIAVMREALVKVNKLDLPFHAASAVMDALAAAANKLGVK